MFHSTTNEHANAITYYIPGATVEIFGSALPPATGASNEILFKKGSGSFSKNYRITHKK